MNDEKTNKIMSSEELDDVLPKYEPIKLSGKNLGQNYVSAFNTGMNIYQCINYLQGNIDLTINAVNDVVKSWNTEVSESIDQSKAIVRETTTEQFNTEWTNKQPELIEQVNTLTTNQFNNEKSVFNNELDTLNARMDTLNASMDTFSNPNLLINPDFKINQRGSSTYTTTSESPIYTVDRWMLSRGKATVNSDGTVTVTATGGETNKEAYFQQKLENAISSAYTISMEVVSISGTVGIEIDGVWETVTTGKNVFQGVNSNNNFNSVGLQLSVGASITLKYMKLEQGSIATPFVAPNPAEELTKCFRFKYIGKAVLRARCTGGQVFGFTKDLPTKLRTKPTTTFKSIDSYNINTVDVTLAEENNVVYISGTAENTNQTVINVVFDLDAEIY